ncbi:TetR/AcrR family transcriptional regulator [Mycolicibacterium bacteremicum]|uniref:HTH tetR-type domain-containing protein n=1 Tax=Mycolicibacterium bacteremicum TaxID=564198 RepID=A0A1W9YUI7_MYCBA|nr:TetR/AcrR family transcriptional regulator [Mycolicibacterium bacteremicum]MCV7431073.1 TetR/AcrR family transcriptional regulator [Mycolicibacterium bacteremicum]ORA03420.1 hypothetical protein BST17_18525 [Mycolicibacterium bacteremicum]
MPKVSQEHLDARRAQILDAATRRFARQGFHATTMQDVLMESDLSAGAVYRYFRGKNELVAAVAERVLAGAHVQLQSVLLADPVPTPADAVHGVVAAIDPGDHDDPLRMAVQVWGEALRDENLARLAGDGYGQIRGLFVTYARRAAEAGLLPAGTDPAAAGSAYFSLVPGYMLQRLLLGDVSPAGYADALKATLR